MSNSNKHKHVNDEHGWKTFHLVALSAAHVAGKDNVQADYLSRNALDPGEWELNVAVFHDVTKRWGTPVMDLMATFLNAKASRICSGRREHMSEVLDGLVQPWPLDNLLYVFPPWPMIGRVIHRIAWHRGLVVLIAPDWPRQPWYADLVRLLVESPWRLPVRLNLLSRDPVLVPQVDRFLLAAWLLRGSG